MKQKKLYFKNSKSKFKNLKHIAVNILSNGITFRLLAGTVYLQCVKQMEKGIKKQPKLRPMYTCPTHLKKILRRRPFTAWEKSKRKPSPYV